MTMTQMQLTSDRPPHPVPVGDARPAPVAAFTLAPYTLLRVNNMAWRLPSTDAERMFRVHLDRVHDSDRWRRDIRDEVCDRLYRWVQQRPNDPAAARALALKRD